MKPRTERWKRAIGGLVALTIVTPAAALGMAAPVQAADSEPVRITQVAGHAPALGEFYSCGLVKPTREGWFRLTTTNDTPELSATFFLVDASYNVWATWKGRNTRVNAPAYSEFAYGPRTDQGSDMILPPGDYSYRVVLNGGELNTTLPPEFTGYRGFTVKPWAVSCTRPTPVPLSWSPTIETDSPVASLGERISVFGEGYAAHELVELDLPGSRPVRALSDAMGRVEAVIEGSDSQGEHTISGVGLVSLGRPNDRSVRSPRADNRKR